LFRVTPDEANTARSLVDEANSGAAAVAVVGEPIVPGRGVGELLSASVGLSFWGGVDAVSGTVIDRHHPLCGESVAGKVLAIPNGRGSCTGSQVVLELLLAGQAPAAILLRRPDQIIALGVIVAEELFGHSPRQKLRVRFARTRAEHGATPLQHQLADR